jgi:hypothetical protein
MTDIDLHPGVIHLGTGVVARWPGVVAFIPADPAHQSAVETMFAELGSDPDPADVVRAIRELTIDQSTLTAAAYLMSATGGPMALAHGDVEVLVDGEVALVGADGPNEQQITSGERLTLRSTVEEAATPNAPFDLRRGVAPGGGISLGGAGLPTTGIAVPPPLEPQTGNASGIASHPDDEPPRFEAPFRSVVLFGGAAAGSAAVAEERAALPVARPHPRLDVPTSEGPAGSPSLPTPAHREAEVTAPPRFETAAPADAALGGAVPTTAPAGAGPGAADQVGPAESVFGDAVVVQGIVCSRDHFNNPAAAFCMVCGISMVHVTHNLVPGPRPTLGFVVFDDGSTFGLDRNYVVGREPGEVTTPHTDPLTVQDNNETLSRRHAEIRLIEWLVHIVDLSSTNGTFIWDAQYERWNQITPNQAVPLSPGDTVALGRRTFVFESVTRL